MILLDTNVISEPLRPSPEARVSDWIDAQPLETLYLSAMTVAELRAGVALMPTGKRRTALHEHLQKRVLPMFAGRVLPFDLACTSAYAELMAKVRKAGIGIETADACIAAVAFANGFTVAKRDTSPFHAAGLDVYHPWGGRIRPGTPNKVQGQTHRSPDGKVTGACRGSSEARSPRSTAASHSCRQKFDLLPPSLRGQNASGNSSSGLLAAE